VLYVSIKEFTYGGKAIQRGDVFQEDAEGLSALVRARFVVPKNALPDFDPSTDLPQRPRKRREVKE
jgi:hypothetical protein